MDYFLRHVVDTIANSADPVKQLMKAKELKEKETKVKAVHSNKITKTTEKKRGQIREVYQTRLGDKRPRRYSYAEIIDYLYNYYYPNGKVSDYRFSTIFEKALDQKIRTEAPKEKTIRDYRSSYKAFINEAFGQRDVRMIKPSEVREYIQHITQTTDMTQKRLYKFKGVLNLVFRYCIDPEHALIVVYPVPDRNNIFKKNCHISVKRPEEKAFQPNEISIIKDYLWQRTSKMKYDVNGYAILFSIETGVREGEIPSLKWSDINNNAIHIHSQQNDELKNGQKVYYYNPATKNEKGVSQNGRFFPLTDKIKIILGDLKEKQKKLGIITEWVFCNINGEWITTAGYYEALYRMAKKLQLKLSNNHAFRMALNSYVFIPAGLTAPERAKLLGHSVQTNLNYYTFSKSNEYLNEIGNALDKFNSRDNSMEPQICDGNPKILDFESIKKSPRTASSRE